MSTHFHGEGNIGSAPEYDEYPNGNEEPRRVLRLNVYFDNPIPGKDGYEDRGGFWRPVSGGTAMPNTGFTCSRKACASPSTGVRNATTGPMRTTTRARPIASTPGR